MKEPKTGFVLFSAILAIVCGFWLFSLRKDMAPDFDARQAAMEYGETVTGTASYVKHKGIMNWGVRYADLCYEVEGKTYHCENRFAQNFRKLPGEADYEGRYPVVIHYNDKHPEIGVIECAQKGWKMAKFSLLFCAIFLWINGAIMLIYSLSELKDDYVRMKLRRF